VSLDAAAAARGSLDSLVLEREVHAEVVRVLVQLGAVDLMEERGCGAVVETETDGHTDRHTDRREHGFCKAKHATTTKKIVNTTHVSREAKGNTAAQLLHVAEGDVHGRVDLGLGKGCVVKSVVAGDAKL
jgi:hypothetical protein